jgi:predicted esterase YcpF (UPF0227 family)
MELKILYIHGYGSKGNRSGKAIEKQAKNKFGSVRMLYNHYYDEITSVRQIGEIISRINDDCRKFNPHIVIGSSFGGFLASNILGYVRILINPCLLPSEYINIISPDMPETDLESLKQIERSCLQADNADFDTWGLFSNHDELFSKSGYKSLFQKTYGSRHLRAMDSPHRIAETDIRENLMPIIQKIVEKYNWDGEIKYCRHLADYFDRHPDRLDAFIRGVDEGKQMDKLRVMSLLIDRYMDFCGISLGGRTVMYNMGESVFAEYVKEGKSNFTGEESFCEIMGIINPNYTSEYDKYDIWVLEDEHIVEAAMDMYEEERNGEMRSVLCYGLFLTMLGLARYSLE